MKNMINKLFKESTYLLTAILCIFITSNMSLYNGELHFFNKNFNLDIDVNNKMVIVLILSTWFAMNIGSIDTLSY